LDLQENPTVIAVVAAALVRPDGRILMHRRKLGAQHGGLWEFPGGKVESGESMDLALIREIAEELGVVLESADLVPVGRARDPEIGIVIDLYIARRWAGEPRCIEGEAIAWLLPQELAGLAMPPLDVPLAEALIKALEKPK
jgi:8-oxo-dGTP diphosphatase